MEASEATGDLGGPPRLARWHEARKAERERMGALAAAGVSEAAAYEEPRSRQRVQIRTNTNALERVVGLREKLRRRSEAAGSSGRRSSAEADSLRSSTSDAEESMPVLEAFWRRREKRSRSLTSSGRTAAAMEDAASAAAQAPEEQVVAGAAEIVAGAPDAQQVAGSECGARSSGAVAAARALALKARQKRITFAAGRSEPVAGAADADKTASITMRLKIRSVHGAWQEFLREHPDGFLAEGEVPDFEKTWVFVRDGLINSRRQRSLRIEDLQGGLEKSVQNYVNVMRDWLWPELFPSLLTRSGGMSVGEWRSFWVRLKTRVNSAFSDGGQMSLGRHVQQGAVGETEVAGASTAVEVADVGRAAGRAAVSHRRKQTRGPRTREHASETDLFMVQVRVAEHGTRGVAIGKG